jgi:hypothetical protein
VSAAARFSFQLGTHLAPRAAGNSRLSPFRASGAAPDLWRFNRRSVPRGMALACSPAFAFPLPIARRGAVCVPWRPMCPLAIAMTWTNPRPALILVGAISVGNVWDFTPI